MNEVERLADGQIPLLIYLQNVAAFVSGLPEEKFIRSIIDLVINTTSGAKRPDIKKIPELKEAIIHTDDTVGFAFMQKGLQVAQAVVKLQVPSYFQSMPRLQSNGVPLVFLGTGWLLTDALIMTNHHVINARTEAEADADRDDLQLQVQRATATFDFDSDRTTGMQVPVKELVAWDAGLDYAVLRIAPSGRTPLPCSKSIVDVSVDSVAVNIVQHPAGRSKRYGIRNNLVTASTASELRYFTDTESGSSGSPVLNDDWKVVALHRAALYVSEVNFQGKDTAYVNVGTHISLILDDMKARFPNVAQEVT
ncbi:MAG: serine protease [Sphingobacteriales bacterium]|nr:MAG: serine protease [Sphingobacteriales bacterium]